MRLPGYGIFLVLSTIVDIVKVVVGVEDFEAVPGLAESIYVVEGVEFLTDLIFSGTLFALLPALYLVPRLYGKIEPLLGMKPRNNNVNYPIKEDSNTEIYRDKHCVNSSRFLYCGTYQKQILNYLFGSLEWVEIYGTFFYLGDYWSCCPLFHCYHFIFIKKRERNKFKRGYE